MVDDSSSSKIDIGQSAEGIIGQTVIGATIVYGSVIYNNFSDEPNAGKDQTQALQIGPNPYKGLLAFQETDGERFFGRDSQIKKLWEQFRLLHEDESSIRVLTIYGPSGSGKSSLARAGLIHELAKRPLQGRDQARVAVLVPGSHPLEALATVLARIATNDSTPVAKTREFTAELKEENAVGAYDGLRRIADALPEIAISPLIVLVDQLEEVITLCEDPVEREAFIGNLLCSAAEHSKRVSVILTLRSDFLGATQKYGQLNQLIESQGFFVAAMSIEGLREAIAKPAQLAGHPLDQSTISLLIEQTEGREGALPLLQFALTQIWAELAEGNEPSKTLENIGGVGGALAGEAQRIYTTLDPEEQKIARRVFVGLVQLGEGTKDTRRRTELERVVSHRDSLEQVRKVIARFSGRGARLITLAEDAGTVTAEVTHETLFDHWQQLRDWLEDSRSGLRFQRRFDEAAMMWLENGKPEGSLWRSPDLDLLGNYQVDSGDDMTPLQVEFFNASVDADATRKKVEQDRIKTKQKLAEAKLKAAEERAKAQKDLAETTEKAAKRQKQQQRLLTGVMGVGLVLTSGTSLFAAYQVQQAQRQRVEQLAANAQVLLSSDLVAAEINAIAAAGLNQSWLLQIISKPEPRILDSVLLDVVRENHERNQLIHEDDIHSVVFSPDGNRIASGSRDKKVWMWNVSTGQPIGKPLQGHEDDVVSVAFSPDGNRIVSGSKDKTVRVWDADTGQPVGKPFQGHKGLVHSVAFSPDGNRIVSGSYDDTVRVWDVSTGQPIGKPLQGHEDDVVSVAFSPDGNRVVSGSGDDTVRVWDADTGQPIGKPFSGHEDGVLSVAFSPDGNRVVSGSEDNTVRVWDVSTGQPIGKPFQGHEDDVVSVAFSPDGNRIVSGGGDKTVRVWDADTGQPVSKPFQGHETVITSVAFSPDSKRIVSSSLNKTVRVWDVSTGQPISKPFQGHEDEVLSVAFSPDGNRIVSGSKDKTVRVWDADTGQPVSKPLNGHKSYVHLVGFSPNGNRIVSGSYDNTVRVWDADTGQPIGKPFQSKNWIDSVTFSSTGEILIFSSFANVIRVWDVSTGQPILGKPLQGHEDNILSATFSLDGQHIAIGNYKVVRVWDVSTGQPISKPFQGHEDGVLSVAFSPDGNRVVSGSKDRTVRVWDVSTGQPIGKPFQGHELDVLSVAFSPDGNRIVSGSEDKTKRVWNIHLRHLLQIACNQLRYHPSLTQPRVDVAREAKKTCEEYVWKN